MEIHAATAPVAYYLLHLSMASRDGRHPLSNPRGQPGWEERARRRESLLPLLALPVKRLLCNDDHNPASELLPKPPIRDREDPTMLSKALDETLILGYDLFDPSENVSGYFLDLLRVEPFGHCHVCGEVREECCKGFAFRLGDGAGLVGSGGFPKAEEATCKFMPHSRQNLEPLGSSIWHSGHFMASPAMPLREGW